MEISLWWDIDKLVKLNWNVSSAIQLMLTDIALIIQNSAKVNAPYKTGNLRRSISSQFNNIQKWFVIVWSPVAYARVREYSNNLHPETKFYLKRWYTENEAEIQNIIQRSLHKELK